jgi:hypothetical protein
MRRDREERKGDGMQSMLAFKARWMGAGGGARRLGNGSSNTR